MNNQIGSIVKFTDASWGVYCGVEAETKEAEIYGVVMLVAQYFARMYSTVRIDKEARHNLTQVLNNPNLLYAVLTRSMDSYSNFYGLGEVNLRYDLTKTQEAKKECNFFVRYDVHGHFAPKFQAKGFGFLGKNIESASISACLATAVFLIETHEDDEDFEKAVMATIRTLGLKILPKQKLSILEESIAIKETVQFVTNSMI